MEITMNSKPGLLSRFWQFLLGTSEATVAIHYRAPWGRSCAAR
jgi:hypothetical protein